MRKFFTALVVIPAGPDLHRLRGRQPSSGDGVVRSVQFDRSVGRGHAAAVRRDHCGGDFGRGGGRHRRPGSGSAAGGAPRASTRPMPGRRGRNWPICGPLRRFRERDPQRLPAPLAGRRLRGHRARQAGRDVVEPAPSALFQPVDRPASPYPLPDENHVPDRQNLRPVHARDARRRAGGRRRHGGLRVLSAVAAASRASRRRATSAGRPRAARSKSR